MVSLEQVTETDSVLVENIHPGTTADMVTLYFESQRGGAQQVKEVVVLSEGMTKVTFVSYECKFARVFVNTKFLLADKPVKI